MKVRTLSCMVIATLAILTSGIMSAHAQDDGWRGDGPGGGGGFGGPGGGPPGGGPGRGGSSLAAGDLTVALLGKRVSLTAAQKTKLGSIQNGVKAKRDSLKQSQQAMRQQMQKMRKNEQALQTAQQGASRQINTILSSSQQVKVNAILRDANLLRSVGLPYQTLDSVTLTDAERTALTKLSQSDRRDGEGMRGWGQSREERSQKALTALTAAHRTYIKSYASAHPEPRPSFQDFGGPGGGGGFGGPGGGPGGPPPGGFPGEGFAGAP